MRIVLFILMLSSLAFGYNYSSVILKAQSSIFPKIMLLDKKLEEKLINGKIVYTIAYDKSDYHTALHISELINEKYKGKFGKYEYRIDLVDFADISANTEATAIYALYSDEHIKKVSSIAKDKGIVSFSYDIDNLKNGLLFSLMLEKSTVLYLNKDNLYINKVDFVETLYQIVKFIDKNNS